MLKDTDYTKGIHYRLDKLRMIQTAITGHIVETKWFILRADGMLTAFPGYAWNGSNVVWDTKACMEASMWHDILVEMINAGRIPKSYRAYGDQLYYDVMVKDGMFKPIAWSRLQGLRLWSIFSKGNE